MKATILLAFVLCYHALRWALDNLLIPLLIAGVFYASYRNKSLTGLYFGAVAVVLEALRLEVRAIVRKWRE